MFISATVRNTSFVPDAARWQNGSAMVAAVTILARLKFIIVIVAKISNIEF